MVDLEITFSRYFNNIEILLLFYYPLEILQLLFGTLFARCLEKEIFFWDRVI